MATTANTETLATAVVGELLFNPKVRPHDLAEALDWSLDRTRRAIRRGEFGEPLGEDERDLHVTVAGCAAYAAAHPDALPPLGLFARAVSLRQLAAGCWPRDAKRMPLPSVMQELASR